MASRVSIRFTESAEADLVAVREWYSSQDAADIGKRLVAQVVERVEQLAMFPDSGKMVPEFETPWLRELEMPPFRMVYRRDEGSVTIVRVWRSERLMDPELDGNA